MSDATSNPPGGFPTSLSSVSLSSESSSSMSSQVTGLRLRSEGNGGPSRCQPHQCSRSQPTRTPEGRPSSRTRRPRVRKRSRRQPQLHRLDEFLVQSGKERNVVHSVWVLLILPVNGFRFSPVRVATLRLRRCPAKPARGL